MTTPDVPDWVKPGLAVMVVAMVDNIQKGRPRRMEVSRIGPRHVIITDAMGNEQKFVTSTLSRVRPSGGYDVLRSPQDPSIDL